MNKKLGEKFQRLKDIIFSMGSALIAYSGGVDSTLLLKVASSLLERILAVTADSPTFPSQELKFAQRMAKRLGVRHMVIQSRELANPNFLKNDRDRCYWCKKELFSRLRRIARREGIDYVVEGSNFSDKDDFRPGLGAIQELGVRSPLMEAELTKEDVRRLSRYLSLLTWDKPSFACLASRIPFGVKITPHLLKKVEEAERVLRKKGFRQVRVRDYQETARIEVEPEKIPALIKKKIRDSITREFKKLGYRYITLDLEGYRMGSMNPGER